jgi:uncharacterized membrane protein YbhN (UPF0104 family)
VTTDVDDDAADATDRQTVPGDGFADDMPGLPGRAARALGKARQAAARPSVRPWLLLAAAGAFVAMAVGSFRSLPDEGRSGNLWLVAVLVLVATPATLVLNALEYRWMAQTLDHDVDFDNAVRVSLVASLANYLPAPGGVAVRTAALKRAGSTVGSALSINAVAVVMWAGTAGLIAGAGLVAATERVVAGLVTTVLGAGAIAASGLLLRRRSPVWRRRFVQLLLRDCGIVLVSGLRVWISLAAIGQHTNLGAAIAIASSVVIAALVGIFPAGLGLREGIAGGLAAAVGVPAAAAVAASAVDRVASQVGMALCAPALGVRWREVTGSPAADGARPEGGRTGRFRSD